jgi:hypothetical protein
MTKLRGLLFGLAMCGLVGLTGSQVRGESITMTIDVTGASFLVDAVATPGATTYSVDAAGLLAINGFLTSNGSQYQFVSLGGSSNFPGSSSQGNLVLTGEIHSVVGGGSDAFLKITESESDFTSPTGPSGTLMSSSTGNFTNQPGGAGHTASSAFNATSTSTYDVFSATTDPNPAGGMASVGIAPVSTLYTLTNVATFGLAAASTNDIVDSFGVTATVTAVVPEPASVVMLLTGMPLPLVVVGLLRRRRRAVA